MAAWRYELPRASLRIGNDDPRIIECRITRVRDRARLADRDRCLRLFGQSIAANRKRMFSQWLMIFELDFACRRSAHRRARRRDRDRAPARPGPAAPAAPGRQAHVVDPRPAGHRIVNARVGECSLSPLSGLASVWGGAAFEPGCPERAIGPLVGLPLFLVDERKTLAVISGEFSSVTRSSNSSV